MCRIRSVALLAATLGSLPATAAERVAAAPYPERAIRLVSPYSPTSGGDAVARVLAGRLGEVWEQQVVLDNRPAGNGVAAAEIAARALPDGYTMLLATVGTHAINPALHRRLPFDVVADCTPVTQIGWSPHVVVVHPSLQVANVQALAVLAKAKAGALRYGSDAAGSLQHLTGLLFGMAAGVDLVHVVYKGTGPATVDLIAGRLALEFGSARAVLPHAKTGRLQAIAVTGPERVRELPDVPAVAESLPGFEAVAWWGIVGPARLPAAIQTRFHAEVERALARADVQARFAEQGVEPRSGTPAGFSQYLRSELAKWTKAGRASGVVLD